MHCVACAASCIILLRSGADSQAACRKEQLLPLHHAARAGKNGVIRELLEAKGQVLPPTAASLHAAPSASVAFAQLHAPANCSMIILENAPNTLCCAPTGAAAPSRQQAMSAGTNLLCLHNICWQPLLVVTQPAEMQVHVMLCALAFATAFEFSALSRLLCVVLSCLLLSRIPHLLSTTLQAALAIDNPAGCTCYRQHCRLSELCLCDWCMIFCLDHSG